MQVLKEMTSFNTIPSIVFCIIKYGIGITNVYSKPFINSIKKF